LEFKRKLYLDENAVPCHQVIIYKLFKSQMLSVSIRKGFQSCENGLFSVLEYTKIAYIQRVCASNNIWVMYFFNTCGQRKLPNIIEKLFKYLLMQEMEEHYLNSIKLFS